MASKPAVKEGVREHFQRVGLDELERKVRLGFDVNADDLEARQVVARARAAGLAVRVKQPRSLAHLCLRRESAYSCWRSGAPHFQPIAKPTPAHAANSSSRRRLRAVTPSPTGPE